MNDELETHLQTLRHRPLPAEWRDTILATAERAALQSQPRSLIRALAPPHWLTWSMAAAWLLIATLHSLTPASPPATAAAAIASDSSEQVWKHRQDLLASLLDTNTTPSPQP